jgi:N utilization substance protein B
MQLPIKKQREILLQLLFSWEVSEKLTTEDRAHVLMESLEVSKKNVLLVEEKLQTIILSLDRIDRSIEEACIDYQLERISLIDKNVLRIAVYELLFEGVDPKIVIDEALRLSKKFSSPEAVSFVHAIVDEVNKRERAEALV